MSKSIRNIKSPCYVMDENKLAQNIKVLQQIRHRSKAKILLALKSFAAYKAFPLISPHLDGVTASSLYEALLAQKHFGKEIHTYCPVYDPNDFDTLADLSPHLVFNSLNQWETYRSKTNREGIGLRIHPGHESVHHDIYNPSARGSRFGVPFEQIPDGLPAGIDGIHFHALFESGADQLESLIATIEDKFSTHLHQAKWLNMGGGHALTSQGYDVEKLITLLIRLREQYHLQIYIEPGSAVTWNAGHLASTIIDIVENHGQKTAMLDISFTAHMPDCLEMPYRPDVRRSRPETDPHAGHTYRLGGNSCLSGDFMGGNKNGQAENLSYYRFDQPLTVGDQLIFEDMMHYTMVKTTMFNGLRHPSFAILRESGEIDIIRQYGYSDYEMRMS